MISGFVSMICSFGYFSRGSFHFMPLFSLMAFFRSWGADVSFLEANLACVNQFVDRSSSRYVEHDHRRSSNIHLSIFASTWWLTVPALVDWSKYSFVQCSSQIELYHISLRAQAGETEEWIPDHPANPLSGLFPQMTFRLLAPIHTFQPTTEARPVNLAAHSLPLTLARPGTKIR